MVTKGQQCQTFGSSRSGGFGLKLLFTIKRELEIFTIDVLSLLLLFFLPDSFCILCSLKIIDY